MNVVKTLLLSTTATVCAFGMGNVATATYYVGNDGLLLNAHSMDAVFVKASNIHVNNENSAVINSSTPKTLPSQPSPKNVVNGDEVRVVLSLKKRRVYVYSGDIVVNNYPVAVGKKGWETPQGEFKVFSMEIDPVFKSFKTGRMIQPGSENPLGPRWIGIWTDGKTQLGFHGTNQPELIGKGVSHGCIRMHNKHAIALYEQVRIGTVVKIEP